MPKVNCVVINCSNSTYKLKKWRQENCYERNDFYSSCKVEDCFIVYHHSNYTVFQAY